MKHDDLCITEKDYIEEHSTKENWLDIFTLANQMEIDYQKIVNYRRRILGIAKAKKLLDQDFLDVIKRDKATEQPHLTEDKPGDKPEANAKLEKIRGLLDLLDTEMQEIKGILHGSLKS